ncbi:hypothetical protein MTO96_035557 [Rhipicephalus appendiculatus]
MSTSGKVSEVMCPLKESQKGTRISIHDPGTSLNELPKKIPRQRTLEQGTDTEQETQHKDISEASQHYRCLLKPDIEEAEAERQAALREIRQLQRRIDEKARQAEEERKLGREFQEGKDKIDEQIKKLEARLYDAKLECELEKARRVDVERQVGDALDQQARLKRELAACSELGSQWSLTGTSSRDKHGGRPLSVEALRSALR